MQKKVKIAVSELRIGEELPWSIYDPDGQLLHSEGQVIVDRDKLDSLCKHDIFRMVTVSNEDPNEASPFRRLAEISKGLGWVFDAIEAADPAIKEKLEKLTAELDTLCLTAPNAMLASVHLPHTRTSAIAHAIQFAILCHTLFAKQNMPAEERQAVLRVFP